jgi:hypothetical protein
MLPPGLQTKPTSPSSIRNAKSRGKTSRVWRGIGKMLYRITRKYVEVSSKKGLGITPNEWEMMWGDPFGVQSATIRPQCDDFEYQFEVGDLIKVAPGFFQVGLAPGDVGVVMKKIVMYSTQTSSDGPAYQIAWQKEGKHPIHIREFMLVPVKKK